ncbi:MAG: hypothetical protein AAGG11_17330 [Pseudomonadota bacterium]
MAGTIGRETEGREAEGRAEDAAGTVTPGGIRIIGNIRPEDDYTHELGPEENFNESVYFNFFDPAQNRGGFLRIGNRANEGYAEVTIMLWNPDGSARFSYGKPEIADNAGWHAGGLHIEVLRPAELLRTTFQGDLLSLADPRAMADPRRAFKDNPRQPVHLILEHAAVGPLYGHVGEPGDGNEFARAHTEQHMRISGTLRFGDEPELAINGWGLRDHSWGPRYWQATPSYRWLTGNFGDDLGMIVTTNGDGVGRGLFQEGQSLVRIDSAVVSTTYEPGTRYHRSLSAVLDLEDGRRRELNGEVMGFIPLRNRRAGSHTHVGEGMTAYTLEDGRKGYGLSEYLDQEGNR